MSRIYVRLTTPAQKAFTIVELLIVIVVIAILAAIGIVAYSGTQSRAHDSAIQQDLRNISTIMEMYRATEGAYPPLRSLTPEHGIRLTKNAYGRDGQNRNASYCVSEDNTQYIFYAVSNSGRNFQVRSTDGMQATNRVQGYNICSRVGRSGTQPDQALQPGGWQAWAN